MLCKLLSKNVGLLLKKSFGCTKVNEDISHAKALGN